MELVEWVESSRRRPGPTNTAARKTGEAAIVFAPSAMFMGPGLRRDDSSAGSRAERCYTGGRVGRICDRAARSDARSARLPAGAEARAQLHRPSRLRLDLHLADRALL